MPHQLAASVSAFLFPHLHLHQYIDNHWLQITGKTALEEENTRKASYR